MKISLQDTNYSASVFAVARVLFRPVPDRLKRELSPGRKGVLLNTGDFFEGELRLVDKDQVKVASILFGPRTFPYDKVLAVTLSAAIEMPAKYLVRTSDGSTIRASAISAAQDSLIAEELKLGPLQLPLAQLAELRRADIPVRRTVKQPAPANPKLPMIKRLRTPMTRCRRRSNHSGPISLSEQD
jgi:hypothetical protein